MGKINIWRYKNILKLNLQRSPLHNVAHIHGIRACFVVPPGYLFFHCCFLVIFFTLFSLMTKSPGISDPFSGNVHVRCFRGYLLHCGYYYQIQKWASCCFLVFCILSPAIFWSIKTIFSNNSEGNPTLPLSDVHFPLDALWLVTVDRSLWKTHYRILPDLLPGSAVRWRAPGMFGIFCIIHFCIFYLFRRRGGFIIFSVQLCLLGRTRATNNGHAHWHSHANFPMFELLYLLLNQVNIFPHCMFSSIWLHYISPDSRHGAYETVNGYLVIICIHLQHWTPPDVPISTQIISRDE